MGCGGGGFTYQVLPGVEVGAGSDCEVAGAVGAGRMNQSAGVVEVEAPPCV